MVVEDSVQKNKKHYTDLASVLMLEKEDCKEALKEYAQLAGSTLLPGYHAFVLRFAVLGAVSSALGLSFGFIFSQAFLYLISGSYFQITGNSLPPPQLVLMSFGIWGLVLSAVIGWVYSTTHERQYINSRTVSIIVSSTSSFILFALMLTLFGFPDRTVAGDTIWDAPFSPVRMLTVVILSGIIGGIVIGGFNS